MWPHGVIVDGGGCMVMEFGLWLRSVMVVVMVSGARVIMVRE